MSGRLRQPRQDPALGGRQRDRGVVAELHGLLQQVQAQVPHAQAPVLLELRPAPGCTGQRVHARQQLGRVERLTQEVVGAQAQRGHAIRDAGATGRHGQDGHPGADAHRLAQPEAIQVGHHQVGDH